ncbi:helix-turn-helix transcriptional regulator [Verrucomicrobium spinosum]|uniref:helix-turn-helix transcriptional regulator n=1 Tax=Verrucomicrobium spinosum TaxID=2736 RepID=UPI0009E8ECAA|nr:HTH domain-containing protein [Verrucomicrobium spinosum]
MNRIDRLTGMILLLQSHRVITAERVADHFEISVRTVYRDLAALGEAGVPIVAEAGVGYSLMRGYHMPPVMFTEDEAAALFVSGEVTEQVADDSLRMALRSALLKVRSVLPRERHDFLNRLQPAVGVWLSLHDGEDETGRPDCLMPLQQAVVRKRCAVLHYNAGARGEVTTRQVEPLGSCTMPGIGTSSPTAACARTSEISGSTGFPGGRSRRILLKVTKVFL